MSASDSSSDAGTSSSDRALSFFRDRFELSDSSLATALDTALERRVDYADLYFEYTTTDSVSLEEGLVKSGDRHLEQGVGVRAVRGERVSRAEEARPLHRERAVRLQLAACSLQLVACSL